MINSDENTHTHDLTAKTHAYIGGKTNISEHIVENIYRLHITLKMSQFWVKYR